MFQRRQYTQGWPRDDQSNCSWETASFGQYPDRLQRLEYPNYYERVNQQALALPEQRVFPGPQVDSRLKRKCCVLFVAILIMTYFPAILFVYWNNLIYPQLENQSFGRLNEWLEKISMKADVIAQNSRIL